MPRISRRNLLKRTAALAAASPLALHAAPKDGEAPTSTVKTEVIPLDG